MNKEKMEKDLKSLTPKRKAVFLLMLSERLRGEVKHHRHSNAQTEKVFDTFDLAMNRVRSWLSGDLSDADAIRYPVYNGDGTDISDIVLDFEEFLPDPDIELVGSMVTTAVLFAAFLQYKEDGVEHLPYPYEGDLNDAQLADWIDIDQQRSSPAFRARFDELWEAQFRPDAKPG